MEDLRVDGITKSFGKNTIFRDFGYSFEREKIYVLRGPSGVGKTTLLRIIAGLDRDFSGTVIGGGIGNVSYVFQEHRLFPTLTALDNAAISSNAPEVRESARALLIELGFTEDELKLRPHELSGGMKQRVSIARALVDKAPVLLLDEVTKELDTDLAKKVLDLIKKEAEHKTVIMVTHNPDEAELLGATEIFIEKAQ